MAYRSYYKTPKPTTSSFSASNKLSLQTELENLQNELQNLQQRRPTQYQNNFADLEQFFMNKFILIGGCVLLGIGIGYLIFNSNRQRCLSWKT